MVQCNFCGSSSSDYPNIEQVRFHIKQVHMPGRRVALGVSPIKAKEIEEAKNNPIKDNLQKIADQVSPETGGQHDPLAKPQRKPILLEYKYTGECPTDGLPIKTIPLKAGDGLYMVAWCENCNKQYQSIEVIPIEDMTKDKWLVEHNADIAEEIAIQENKGVWPINKFRKK